jgi:hypothetical protein
MTAAEYKKMRYSHEQRISKLTSLLLSVIKQETPFYFICPPYDRYTIEGDFLLTYNHQEVLQ